MAVKVAVAGATWATAVCIEVLRIHGYEPIVLGQKHSDRVAGWCDLNPDYWFDHINDEADLLAILDLDVLFVVGLSQLVAGHILDQPRFGCVGFHPTRLPKGRGRAPIAWLVLGETEGAATFFQLDEGIDSGPIFVQVPFDVGPDDYAQDVCDRITGAMIEALCQWLPHLEEWKSTPQDHTQATYLPARRPADGEIDWTQPVEDIHRLIRATSRPHPGAWTGNRTVWRATIVDGQLRADEWEPR